MRPVVAVAFIVTVASGSAVAALVQREQLFPNTKKNGRATVEYKNDGFAVVANYDYSQRNHNTPWLLIDVAAASERRFTIHRNHFRLVTPEGRELKVASQEALIADSSRVRFVVQNAQIWRRHLAEYFSQRGHQEQLSFYSFPGEGIVHNEAIVDNDRVTLGELFFKIPEGRWQDGTYRLVIDHERMKAALPITLQ